jgi:hypothetical protein
MIIVNWFSALNMYNVKYCKFLFDNCYQKKQEKEKSV